MEEEMRITPKSTLCKNINELLSQGYEVDYDNEPVPGKIIKPETHWDTPTYKPWGFDDIDSRKSSVHRQKRSRMSGSGG